MAFARAGAWVDRLRPDHSPSSPSTRQVSLGPLVGAGSVVLAALLWGLANVVLRQAEGAIAPVPLILIRFAEVAVLSLPVLIRTRLPRSLVLATMGTGAIIGAATAAQAIAMTTIPVDQVAFIGALYVILTPLTTALLHGRWPGWRWSALALASLCGVVLLIGHLTWVQGSGIWWAVAGAVGITLQIVALGRVAPRVPPLAVAGWQSVGASLTLLIWCLASQQSLAAAGLDVTRWAPGVWIGVLYLGIPAGLIALWLQARGQRRASPALTALALNTEPLWTALFAWGLLGEVLDPTQAVGALLVVVSLSVSALLPTPA